ncbi:unnamed protein product [Paramecium sonneborni]|uniref:Uncharacterized protein n=1 Tax=Paramecium sonneborni TaxID=65129 RepID=A0A8S1LGD4_9CILI|nr:unnamed protein product [Paramecium sonneborni]
MKLIKIKLSLLKQNHQLLHIQQWIKDDVESIYELKEFHSIQELQVSLIYQTVMHNKYVESPSYSIHLLSLLLKLKLQSIYQQKLIHQHYVDQIQI